MSTRQVPHDRDAEASVIGAMLLSMDAVRDAISAIEPGDFYNPKHQMVYATMLALRKDGHPIDAVSVSSELKVLAPDTDWLGLLLEAQSFCPSISGVGRYAEAVAATAMRRRLLMLAADVSEAAYGGQGAGDIIDMMKSRMSEVSMRATGQGPMDELMTSTEFVRNLSDKPVDWAIPGVLGRRERLLIVAPEGSGKGVLMRQISVAVGGGVHPFSQRPCPQLPTLYLDLENEERTIGHQLDLSLKGGRRILQEPDLSFILSRPEGLDLRTSAAQVYLERAMQEIRPAILCIGPIYKAARKRPNENWEDATLELFVVLDDLRTRFNCALVMEHHAPKGSGVRDLLPFGSSAWLRWPEYGWKLEPTQVDRQGRPERLDLGTFRGNRMDVDMPDYLVRGGDSNLPWCAMRNPR